MAPPEPAGQHTVRRHNAALVLGAVADEPGVSRAGIAAGTGLAKATVSAIVDRLIAARLVVDTGPLVRSGRGRRGTGLSVSDRGPHGLGAEIGVDYVATCLVDLTGTLHAYRVRPGDNRARTQRAVLAGLTRAVRTALREADRRAVPVGGVGVAVPGLVDAGTGLLRLAPNLGWHKVDLAAALAERLPLDGVPVVVGNEANFAASAELAAGVAHPGLRDFVHVSGEVGIGAGIVTGGALLTGVRGFGGEIGHICVDPAGPACGCGGRGCLERLAGLEAILRDAGLDLDAPPAVLVGRLVARLESGDARAKTAVRAAGRWLGAGLATVLNVVDIPAVVLGGSYAALEPWLREPLAAELAARVVSADWSPVRLLASGLGPEAAAYGAGSAAVRAIIADPDTFIGG
jgi:predicted NBD/HSP70 family sugar kinase